MNAQQKAAFNRGYVAACCNIVHMHSEPTIAYDILQELGVSMSDIDSLDLDEYDKEAMNQMRAVASAEIRKQS